MEDYDAQSIERKWQDAWEAEGTNQFTEEQIRDAPDPYYNLMMFPYPSAEGLHIGNIYAFTGADVHGRYWRLRGKSVFEPIGFDAFGIHSENFALKLGTNPNKLIPDNIANFTRQLKRMGGMFDWSHAVDTTDVDYYRWTQWVFLQLFKAGLVERREAPVNWCPSCLTVLANEQVISGQCERCDSNVEQRQMPQWFFRITEYAERLLNNLETLDWSETTKKAQQNWIGQSEGAEIDFEVDGVDAKIRVFTTRPDTLYGATYMVLAPEHQLVDQITSEDQRDAVSAYLKRVRQRDMVERQKVDQEKTGVFTGSYCVNPINGERIPIWVADYVLIEYGTGAIMAVPGHDQRDFDFASTFDLPIRRVIAGPEDSADSPLVEAYVADGRLVNSGDHDGLAVDEGKAAITQRLVETGEGTKAVNYRLHDWCISRQRYWGPPIPVIHCSECGAVPVPDDDLPVLLPYIDDFEPDQSGLSPLARNDAWVNVNCPCCGNEAKRETDVSDTFLDSGWYFLRYPCSQRGDTAVAPEILDKWLPVDMYIGGNEHAVLHLLYSRFLTMALHDLGHLDFDEPFKRFRAHGLIIREGRKMSKSRGNVVVPDEVIARYGADTTRTYLMFLGPFEQGGDYRGQGIQGPYGFLNRLWQSVVDSVDTPGDEEVLRALHGTIKQVTEDIPALRYNTAIAAMMEYLNVVRAGGRTVAREEVAPLVTLVSPFAPHIAAELYERLGHSASFWDTARWPEFDAKLATVDVVEVPVQVNGKRRGAVNVSVDAEESTVVEAAMSHENVSRYLRESTIRKVIYRPGRMINLVVTQNRSS